MLAIKFLLLLVSVFAGYFLGYIFTEKYPIANKWKILDFEGFKCRQCLSFHIAWVTSTVISLLFEDWIMLIVGVVFAFALFAGLKIDQKIKTIKIEE